MYQKYTMEYFIHFFTIKGIIQFIKTRGIICKRTKRLAGVIEIHVNTKQHQDALTKSFQNVRFLLIQLISYMTWLSPSKIPSAKINAARTIVSVD